MTEQVINIERMEQIINIFGSFDENIRFIENEYRVKISNRGSNIKIIGDPEDTMRGKAVIEGLITLSNRGETINEQNVRYVMALVNEGNNARITELNTDVICITAKGRPIKTKTIGQANYVDAIKKNTIVLGIGPAGTGKTYIAVAMAVAAFRNRDVNKIILTRPAVEAGENLGFLPGDLLNKIDPYLRPLNDALFDMLGPDTYQKYVERGNIEVAPLAYMRGRTLEDAFIILDEAQNTTPVQMKMFLTRLGFNSKIVITGDITQIDLPFSARCGLIEASKILEDVEGIKIVRLTEKDVVRHQLVQKIIKAYEKYELNKEANKNNGQA